MLYREIVDSLTLLLALSLMYFFLVNQRRLSPGQRQFATGVLFGGVGIVIMLTPVQYMPGIILDSRSIPLAMAALFGGPLGAMTSFAMMAAYRLWHGGSGLYAGLILMAGTTVMGSCYYFWCRKGLVSLKAPHLYLFGLVLTLFHLICILLIPSVGINLFRDLALPMLLFFPFGVLFIGTILKELESRSLMELALAKSEERYRILFEQTADATFVFSGNRFRDCNDATLAMLGLESKAELLGRHPADISPPEQPDGVSSRIKADNLIAEAHERGNCRFEWYSRDKSGNIFPLEILLTAIHLEEEKILYGVARDIAERKAAEDLLDEQVNILTLGADIGIALTKGVDLQKTLQICSQHLVDHLDAVFARIWLMDRQEDVLTLMASAGKYTAINGQHSRKRLDQHNKIGKIALTGTPHLTNEVIDDPQIIDQEWAARDKIQAFAGHPLAIGGKVIGVMAVFSRQLLTHTVLRSLAAVADEIAIGIERMKNESALRENERKYRSIINRTYQLIGILDRDGIIQDVNRSALDLIANQEREVIGKPFWQTPWWRHSPELQAWLKEAVHRAARGEDIHAEVTHPGPGGAIHTIDFTLKPIKNDAGEIDFLVPMGHDITERKRIENELRQAQKMEAIGTLAGGIAHDFNNILTAILGFADLARVNTDTDSQVTRDIDEIEKAAWRAQDLVKQILTFSRQSEQERRPVQLHLIVKEALKLLRASFPSTIEIRQDILIDTDYVEADPTQIHQIIMNLCTNAYHAMRERGGILKVDLHPLQAGVEENEAGLQIKPGKYLHLTVSDTGHGMNQTMLERIFEPYFTTKKKGEGTGLGLAVVHGIVTSCGGHIRVDSAVGRGTVFHIYFPVLDTAGFPQNPQVREDLPGGTEHILFVDDEALITTIGRRMLENLGYRVTVFTDSTEALQCFREAPRNFDLVITDMTMPQMTGAEMTQLMLAVNPRIPIVLCTGYSDLVNEEKAKAIGVREYMMKPLVKEKMAKVIRKVLDEDSAP